MRDEHIGISGWLLADLVLVLAVVFLAMAPGVKAEPPPTPTPNPIAEVVTPTRPPEDDRCLPQSTFKFDQIVVEGVENAATWQHIVGGRVRRELTKEDELVVGSPVTYESASVGAHLAARHADGYRIALIETFGWSATAPFSVDVARRVNEALTREFVASPELLLEGLDPLQPGRWLATYASAQIPRGSARINVYFVRQPQDCPGH